MDINKSAVPDEWCSLFQSEDRRSFERPQSGDDDENDDDPVIEYRADRDVILGRLDIMGVTASLVSERFEAWRTSEILRYESYDFGKDVLAALRLLTYSKWQAAVAEHTRQQGSAGPFRSILEERIHNGDWLWVFGHGTLESIRLLLEARPSVASVAVEISDLIAAGYVGEEEDITERAEELHLVYAPLMPTMVLAEGPSDARILEASLHALLPEYREKFSFFDHAELNVDGGANYLVKFLKAFAAAKASFPLVAIFDNDAAGLVAYRQAKTLALPSNFIVLKLPDIELGWRYPTRGPQGEHEVSINGKACSIEMYLGRKNLELDGILRPVIWGGQAGLNYQGEVQGKVDVQNSFFCEIDSHATSLDAQAAHPELLSVWRLIITAVASNAERLRKMQVVDFSENY